MKTLNRGAIIFERNQNKFSKISSAVDKKTSQIDDVDIINEKLEIFNRDNIAFEKAHEKLFEIPIAIEKEIQCLKDENNNQIENNNLKTDIFLLKEKLHTLKTKKQLFPADKKHKI